eukprot:COSAG03_NODE_4735_length_1450_cov_1.499630_2_plen_229_part_01
MCSTGEHQRSTTRWTPRLQLVQQYARRLHPGAEGESLLPRVSLPPPGHRRGVTKRYQGGDGDDWSWVTSPRGASGRSKVESARELARRQLAAAHSAQAQSSRELSASLHRYVCGPTRPTGHRYVTPPRGEASFARVAFEHGGYALTAVQLGDGEAGAGSIGTTSAQSSALSIRGGADLDSVKPVTLGALDPSVIDARTTVVVMPGRCLAPALCGLRAHPPARPPARPPT